MTPKLLFDSVSLINPAMSNDIIRSIAYNSLLSLATEEGINASGKDEIYGCIFGRDSAITILKILNVLGRDPVCEIDTQRLLAICRRSLLTLTELQGRQFVPESGEEPGKFIHEFRREKYDHLLHGEKPWYVYPDGIFRNYQSLDSTPLALIAMYRYWRLTNDAEFLLKTLPAVEKGLNWILSHADMDKDYLVEYEFPVDHPYGGLRVQSWTDSVESILQKDGTFPVYPIAPVEVQGYTWLALKLWSRHFENTKENSLNSSSFGQKLESQADHMKEQFNKLFIFQDGNYFFASQALDGLKNQINTVTGNPLLLLWASTEDSGPKSILDDNWVPEIVSRAFLPDLFDPDAGIRTMSTLAPTYNPGEDSYHNGSFWPKLNGIAHEGLLKWGFEKEAQMLKDASLKPILHFGSPIELYIKTQDGYTEWKNFKTGQVACREQAWSAAAALDLLTL